MDKLVTLLVYTEHQRLVEEWFPQLPHLHGSPSEPKEETLADVYAAMIAGAKMLNPLKGKEKPQVPISNCVHPKGKLRGGGNSSQSYIVCKDCHARWENSLTTAEIKKYMKEQKSAVTQGGLLSQSPTEMQGMAAAEWMEAGPMTPPRMARAIQIEQEESQRRLQEMQQALHYEQMRSRELERNMQQRIRDQMMRAPREETQGSVPTVMQLQAKSRVRPTTVVDQVADALLDNQDFWPVVEPAEIVELHMQNQEGDVEVVDLLEEEDSGL